MLLEPSQVLIVGRLGKCMSEVVQSVNIMLAILLVGVCVTIYWIFKYDDWNPNPISDSNNSKHSEPVGAGLKELGSRAES